MHRREFIRSIFVSAEGFAWHLKRDVFAHTAAGLSAHEGAAPSEETYAVDERGKLSVQARFLPLVHSIRLAIRIVQRYRPSYVVDFNDKGWHGLVSSVDVRNRLVHPKTIEDLTITDQEIQRAMFGLDWLKKAHASIAQAMRNEHFKSADLLKHLFKGSRNRYPNWKKAGRSSS